MIVISYQEKAERGKDKTGECYSRQTQCTQQKSAGAATDQDANTDCYEHSSCGAEQHATEMLNC